jgi:hypothetical protein
MARRSSFMKLRVHLTAALSSSLRVNPGTGQKKLPEWWEVGVQWHQPVVPASSGAEAEGSLEPKNSNSPLGEKGKRRGWDGRGREGGEREGGKEGGREGEKEGGREEKGKDKKLLGMHQAETQNHAPLSPPKAPQVARDPKPAQLFLWTRCPSCLPSDWPLFHGKSWSLAACGGQSVDGVGWEGMLGRQAQALPTIH